MPNSEDYGREADYFDAHRQWKTGLHRLQRAVSKHASGPRYEGRAELEELVALVGGDPRALISLSQACGMSWRDAICVYGIWIQPSMTRKDLP
jgi:nuclear pore complex protein Nup85